MVHMVTEHVDQGRVLLTETVAIHPGDTLQGA
jgi:folate-dependent phosphoribosylglycinamide formyltransferase PurN